MTQPPPHPTSPAGGGAPIGGPPPAAGDAPPPTGLPPQYAPPPAGWAGRPPPPGVPGGPPPGWPPGQPPPQWAAGPPPPVLGPGGQPLASFGDRLLAYLIDTAIAGAALLVVFVPLLVIFMARVLAMDPETDPDGTVTEPGLFVVEILLPMLLLQAASIVIMFGIYWLYHVEYLKRTGQTLGKKVLKLRVVPLDPTRTLDRRTAGKRYLVQFVGGSLVPGGSYVDGLWQLWDKPWQQCLHDKFAGTVVVKVSR
ncbi:RDD family protein [Micromonospora sp. C95]|uniref:RDD family protein n=1 Tax=Micromonospora sp. C95 TaxID=2824882 RepID=UPI001B3776F2|nr:RDD family protein [Micromonospora sp. C95]MBQ1024382.1 RDD family protein [Micromonospora sp. C95]